MAPYLEDGACLAKTTEPELRRLANSVAALNKLASEAEGALSGFIERLRGPSPRGGESAEAAPLPNGALGDLGFEIEQTRETLLSILGLTNTLKTIA